MNRQLPRFSFNVRDWPLAAKLTSVVLVVLIPATIIINAIILGFQQNSFTAQIGNNLNTLAQSTANTVAAQIGTAVDEMTAFTRNRILIEDILTANASYPESLSAAQQQLKRVDDLWAGAQPGDAIILTRQNVATSRDLRTFINAEPTFSNLIVTDRYGGLVAVSSPPTKYDQSAETWWQVSAGEGGSVYISPPYFDQSLGLYTLTLAVPVLRPNSTEVIGVLHANYSLRGLVDLLADLKVGETGEVLLIEKETGLRLDTTAGSDIRIPLAEWTRVINNTSANYSIGSFLSTESLVTFAPVQNNTGLERINQLDWYVVIRQDADEGLAAQQSILTFGAIITGIGLVILSFITINAARSLTQPISELTRIARDAQSGNLRAKAPITSRDEIGTLSETFNVMIDEIRSFTGSLEDKVNERTDQLSAINDIAAVIASSLDINEVMSKTVNLIRDRLGYYHVSIFLLDEKAENAIIRESTGEVGRIFKERPHTLAVGSQSLIGFVTANRKPRVALDTRADAGHFKNPLLPDTRSEMALPLAIGDALFGALDVQSTEANAFGDEDVAVLQNMANQVAIAINNARLFQQSQDRLNEVSLLNRQYLSRAWDTFSQVHPEAVNLQLDGGLVYPAPELASQGGAIGITAPMLSGDGRTIAIPITLRDEIIGEFALSSPDEKTKWNHEDLTLVDSVVAQVALAVENARLLEETQSALSEAQRLARRERIISEITTKITYGADVKRILQIAADELRRATGSSRAVVRLSSAVTAEPEEVV